MSILSSLSNFFQPHSFTYKAPGPTSPIAPASLLAALIQNNQSEKSNKDRDLLAKVIFGEAASEGKNDQEKLQAMSAVASTIKNRAKNTGKGLVEEATKPNQYTAYSNYLYWDSLNKKIAEPIAKKTYQMATKVADDLISGSLPDTTSGSTFYYNPKKVKQTPSWAKNKTPTTIIGNHQFYKNIAPYNE